MSDPIESNKGVTPDDNSTAKTYELPSNETKISDKTSTVDTALSFDKLCVHSDSESSGDEITAFDRIRASSDSDEGEATKTIKAISVSKELPPVPVTLSTPVTETEEVKVEETLPEDMLEETVKNSEVTKEIIEAKSHNNTDVSSIQEPNNTPDKKVVVEDEQKSKEESDKIQPGVSKDKPKSPEEKSSIQSTGDWNESEKGNKYSQNKDFSREKGKPRKSYPEDSFRDGNKRERGKGRSNRDDRGVRRENYGHDDRFYVSPDTRTNEPEFDSNVIQGRSPPTRSWKGTRGRGGEGKWKHDKFYEDEQGPIAVESTNNSYPSYSSPQSVSQSQYPYKKGRGRGKKQYSDQSPIPGFQRNSPRQERRGRGNPYKEESDVYSSSTRPNRGRGINRYSNYKEDNSGVYHSKPIVFVSQNKKIEPPTDRHKDQDNTRTTLNVDDAVNSDYIQPSSSTALPSISVFSTKPEIDMQQPKRAPQMKYGPYNNKKDTEKYTTTSNSSYTGLGRGKGKILHPVALLQRGQQYKRPTEPVNYEYEKEFVPKKDPKEPISLTPDSNPSFPFTKSEPLHKPERYSTQRMKQAQSADHNNVTTSNVGIPVMNANSPNPGLNRPPSTQDQGYNASMRIGEHPQQETRSSMMDVPYSEFYPTPYKEEMVGNQMSAMHPFNMMPDYMISPDVMKEGDFQQMQFPPFIPQEMTMNMKGAPNMMGGIPYISNPPEYTMGSEVPPNLQSDLFVPMQSYYPPI